MDEPSKPPQDIPPHDYAVIRSAGSMIKWENVYWTWHGGEWVYRGEAPRDVPDELLGGGPIS